MNKKQVTISLDKIGKQCQRLQSKKSIFLFFWLTGIFAHTTTTGVGIYSYDPVANIANEDPIVNTQGDPSIIERFDE